MLMPTVFHENLFDDFFDPFWNDASIERMMNREALVIRLASAVQT